ncbi:MAG: FKBP-type peptidyl-prolyl cis-trans isomerase [Planctomycetota bacterium]|jgi:FKBP-type peptidyl-prolyl cis-trans isomerase SlyD
MSGSQRVQSGKVVTVHYRLTLDGVDEVVDSTEGDEPMAYLHGADNIVPGLEAALEGLGVGETITVTLAPEDAYGEREPDAIQEIPHDAFPDDLEVEVGMQLTAEDEDGELTPLYVRAIAEDHVVVDTNHPLAGETLRYEVTIVGVRDATESEREHGHAHGEDGHAEHD